MLPFLFRQFMFLIDSIDPKSGHRFLNKLMDNKKNYTQNTGKFGVLSIVCVLSFGWHPANAGAWVQKPGNGEVISSVSYHTGTIGFDDQGRQTENIQFSKLESSIYAEYGLVKNWSVITRLAVQQVTLIRGNNVDEGVGYAASQLMLKRNLGEVKSWVFAAQGGLSIPGSTENGLDLRLGSGGAEWEVRALAGRPLRIAGFDGFVDAQFARRFRANEVPNEWHADATLGVYPTKQILLTAQIFAVRGDVAQVDGTRTLSSTNLQGTAVWFYNQRNGIQIFVVKPIAGRNIIVDTAIGIGWWWKF